MNPSELREKWHAIDKEIVDDFNNGCGSYPPLEARIALLNDRFSTACAVLSQLLQHLAEQETTR